MSQVDMWLDTDRHVAPSPTAVVPLTATCRSVEPCRADTSTRPCSSRCPHVDASFSPRRVASTPGSHAIAHRVADASEPRIDVSLRLRPTFDCHARIRSRSTPQTRRPVRRPDFFRRVRLPLLFVGPISFDASDMCSFEQGRRPTHATSHAGRHTLAARDACDGRATALLAAG